MAEVRSKGCQTPYLNCVVVLWPDYRSSAIERGRSQAPCTASCQCSSQVVFYSCLGESFGTHISGHWRGLAKNAAGIVLFMSWFGFKSFCGLIRLRKRLGRGASAPSRLL